MPNIDPEVKQRGKKELKKLTLGPLLLLSFAFVSHSTCSLTECKSGELRGEQGEQLRLALAQPHISVEYVAMNFHSELVYITFPNNETYNLKQFCDTLVRGRVVRLQLRKMSRFSWERAGRVGH